MRVSIESELQYLNISMWVGKLKTAVAHLAQEDEDWLTIASKEALESVIADLDAQILAYTQSNGTPYCPQTGLTLEDLDNVH